MTLERAIADKLLARLRSVAGPVRDIPPERFVSEVRNRTADFLTQIPIELRRAASDAVSDCLGRIIAGNLSRADFAAAMHDQLSKIDEVGEWPQSEVVADAAGRQWRNVVAQIAGRWYNDLAVASKYRVRSNSALAIRLVMAHRHVGAAAARLEQRIAEELPDTPNRVVLGLGDAHSRQQTVARVEFADRQLIYRPHSMATDQVIADICRLVGAPEPPHAFDMGDHGWSEFLTTGPGVTDEAEFYAAVGAWAAVGYLFNANDLHNENFITVGNTPRLIDLETFFQPEFSFLMAPNNRRWANSVLPMGVLPYRIGNGPDSIDVGLVRSRPTPGARHPFPSFMVRTLDDGSRTFIKEDTLPADPEGTVFLGTTIPEIDRVKDQVKSAFIDTARRIVDKLDEVRKIVAAARGIRTRVVLTPTFRYAQVLATAGHPAIADDPFLFTLACAQISLWGNDGVWRSEWAGLMNDEIPLFTMGMTDTEVVLGDGAPLPFPQEKPVASASPAAHLESKLADATAGGLAEQCRWLETSFVGRYPENRIHAATDSARNVSHPRSKLVSHIVDMVLQAAGANDEAVFGTDFLSATVGEEFDRNWQVGPSNDDFYGGSAGTLYFLAHLMQHTYRQWVPSDQIEQLLEKAVAGMVAATTPEPPRADYPTGLCTGSSGLLLTAVACGDAIGWVSGGREHIARQCANGAIAVATHARNANLDDINVDAINGLASQLRAYAEIAEYLPEVRPNLRELARVTRRVTRKWLRNYPESPDDAGYAHSTAGVLDAYLAASHLCGATVDTGLVEQQVQAILAAIHATGNVSQGWCHGMAGFGFLAAHLCDHIDTRAAGESLLSAIRPGLLAPVDHLGLSVCHGVAGLAESLMSLYTATGDEEILDRARYLIDEAIPADLVGDGLTKENYSVSLMCGVAGVGQLLLSAPIVAAPWHPVERMNVLWQKTA